MAQLRRTPSILFILLAIGALFSASIFFLLLWNESRKSAETSQALTTGAATMVRNRLNRSIMLLEGVKALWLGSENVTPEQFRTYATTVAAYLPEMTAIEWVDPGNIVRYVYPLEGENLKAVNFDNNAFPNRLQTITSAKESGTAFITPPILLVQGYPGVIIYVPIFRGDEYLGSAVGVIKIETLFVTLKDSLDWDSYDVVFGMGDAIIPIQGTAIFTAKGERVVNAAGDTVADPSGQRLFFKKDAYSSQLSVANQTWDLRLWHQRNPKYIMILIGIVGAAPILAGLLLVFVVFKKQRALEQANEREREFVSLVAHQLRIPLTELSWMTDSVFETGGAGTMTEEQLATVQEIRSIVRNSVKLINDLLNISRIERGIIEIKCDEAILAQVVDDALKPLTRMASERDIKFTVSVPKRLTVFADHVKSVEAIRNVIDNALKYGPRDSTIEIAAKEKESYAILTVRDHGPGIPEGIWSKLFDKSSAFSKKSGDQHSAGLGLYLTKQFIELMGGDVSFTSSSEGTIFSISLPTYRAEGCGEDENA